MGGKRCFDEKTEISETNKRTSKLVCTPCPDTFFIYCHFIFLFQLTILTKSKQYLLGSEVYYLLTWLPLHPAICLDSIIFHFEYIFYTLIQQRHTWHYVTLIHFFVKCENKKFDFDQFESITYFFFIIHYTPQRPAFDQ